MRRTRDRIGVSEGVRAFLLPASDFFAWLWGLASSFYSLVESAKRLLQGLCQAKDLGAIVIEI